MESWAVQLSVHDYVLTANQTFSENPEKNQQKLSLFVLVSSSELPALILNLFEPVETSAHSPELMYDYRCYNEILGCHRVTIPL